jgi:hypothetical protein
MERYFVKPLVKIATLGKRLSPGILYRQHQLDRGRANAERLLCEISKSTQVRFNGTVFVDAMWDNPNYWIRYALFRSALGLASAKEVGVLGPFRAAYCHKTLKQFGIKGIVQITNLYGDLKAHCHRAEQLLAQTGTSDDILQWELPEDVPTDIIYDGILKRQRLACINLHDPKLIDYVTEALACIAASQRLLDMLDFKLIVLSHGINYHGGSLAWIALKRGIPVMLLYGNYGVPRFAKLSKAAKIHDTTNRPTSTEIAALSLEKSRRLMEIGSTYLNKRRTGRTEDLGARYAYQKRRGIVDRVSMTAEMGWDPSRPIIAVYASNWFDFPHSYGMTHFRDFLDWLHTTVEVAVSNQRVNWLFKAHPCDDWYGGVTLSDLMPALSYPHIRLADKRWNGSALMDCVDGLVTYHGTAGIEFAAAGKPVLLVDRGWYHDVGFAKWPKSRQEYLDLLASEWWKDMDLRETSRKAQVFAGWYFCRPAWQGDFLLDDDSTQWAIYEKIPTLIKGNKDVILREINTIREWFNSGHPHYHTYKMSLADEYIT